MKEERIKILKMVEDGKITVDEATKLIDALKENYPFEFYGEEDFAEKVKQFGKSCESFAKDLGDKVGTFAKEVEPKVRKVTQSVVSKTAEIVDEIAKTLNKCLDNLSFNEECADDCDCGCNCGCGQDQPQEENKGNEN